MDFFESQLGKIAWYNLKNEISENVCNAIFHATVVVGVVKEFIERSGRETWYLKIINTRKKGIWYLKEIQLRKQRSKSQLSKRAKAISCRAEQNVWRRIDPDPSASLRMVFTPSSTNLHPPQIVSISNDI